ncbi:MAG: cell division protein FtsZ [Caldiserica bacterium]|nr:cell division protein FtsZ [Caldisericota bacterium]
MDEREKELGQRWRQVLGAIRDQVLRACLPADPAKVRHSGDVLFIEVESKFKKNYVLRKLPKLREAVEAAFGPVKIQVTELPLVEELERREEEEAAPGARIVVVGVGNGGINALARIRETGLRGVRLVAMDTDSQILSVCRADDKLRLGPEVTGGRSTGGDHHKGKTAAEETAWEIRSLLEGADLVFLTCGLGGGTGTGATPVIAGIARDLGALTVGVVTLPFAFEGTARAERAKEGLRRLREAADVVIVIDNNRLLNLAPRETSVIQAFARADDVLRQGVQGITDLITVPGVVNLDFADVASVLRDAGTAMMGTGEARGENRAVRAAKEASQNPLLEGGTIRGARKILLNVTGGENLTLAEVTQAAETVRKEALTEAELVFGAVVREELADLVRITVIAADFQEIFSMEEEEELPPRKPAERKKKRDRGDLDYPAFLRRLEG